MKIIIACKDNERDSVTKNRKYCVYRISQNDDLYHIFNDECRPIIPIYSQFKNIPYCQIKKEFLSKFGNNKYQQLIEEITTEINQTYSNKISQDKVQLLIGQTVANEVIEAYCYINKIPFDFSRINEQN